MVGTFWDVDWGGAGVAVAALEEGAKTARALRVAANFFHGCMNLSAKIKDQISPRRKWFLPFSFSAPLRLLAPVPDLFFLQSFKVNQTKIKDHSLNTFRYGESLVLGRFNQLQVPVSFRWLESDVLLLFVLSSLQEKKWKAKQPVRWEWLRWWAILEMSAVHPDCHSNNESSLRICFRIY